VSSQSSRVNIQGDGERFSFSPGEKAGMRADVQPIQWRWMAARAGFALAFMRNGG